MSKVTTASLADYAAVINDEYDAANQCANHAIGHARVAGEHLLKAKASLKHGEWLPWLAANIRMSERTARAYMSIAQNWNLLSAKSAVSADLTIEGALKALAKPKAESSAPANPTQPTGPKITADQARSEPIPAPVDEAKPAKPAEPVEVERPQAEPDAPVTELDALRSDYRELIQQAAETQADLDSLSAVVESDDKLKAALAEAKKYREMNRILEERIRGLQNEKNEAIRAAKSWQRKYEALAKKVAA